MSLNNYVIMLKVGEVCKIQAEVMLREGDQLVFEIMDQEGEPRTVAIFNDWLFAFEKSPEVIVPVEEINA